MEKKMDDDLFADEFAKLTTTSCATYIDLVHAILDDPPANRGAFLPWATVKHDFRLRDDEYTIWHGYSGARKSFATTQIMLSLLEQGLTVHAISLEMSQPQFLARMIQQAAGNQRPAGDYRRAFLVKYSDKLMMSTFTGPAAATMVKAYIEYNCSRRGPGQYFFIDPLGFIDTSARPDEESNVMYANQGWFAAWLAMTAHENKCGIHLVHHARKGSALTADDKIPRAQDAAGAGQLTNYADNVVAVWANKTRERATLKQQLGKPLSTKEQEQIDSGYDQVLQVQKQRNAQFHGNINLFWHPPSLQLSERYNERNNVVQMQTTSVE